MATVEAAWQRRADRGEAGANDGRERAPLRDPEPVARERVRARKLGRKRSDLPEALGVDAADPGAVEHVMAGERLDDDALDTASL